MFWEVLWLSRHKQASNPSDKVYGLQGLLPDQQNFLFEADYSMTVGKIFCKCTQALIKQNNNLYAPVGPRLNQPGLPTWVIDLLPNARSGKISYLNNVFRRICAKMLFNACGMQDLFSNVEAERLILRGLFLDRVKTTAPPWREGHIAESIEQWENLALQSHAYDAVYPSGCKRSEAFWRTLARDAIDLPDRTPQRVCAADETSYTSFRQWLCQPAASSTSAIAIDSNFSNSRNTFFIATHYQTFFRTDHDYIGLGDAPRAQDKIWLRAGGSVPFVLRPYAGDSEYAGSYSLVGDCYIHGMMDGEMVGRHGEGEWGKVVLA
ncbi:hypothetical protein BST61_g11298 [Cercospora zeina]